MSSTLSSMLWLVGLGILGWLPFSTAADVLECINLPSGTLLAPTRDSNGVLAFKGVPFAAPPVGDLRWQPPKPVEPWKTPLNASKFGSSCWSSLQPSQGPTSEFSEDCLTINVWTAARNTSEKQAVMVWIFGGGFQFGTSADPQYNGEYLAQKDVVVVSFNYRLAALGFLALDELDKESASPSGNQGLQDQIAALQWVNDNIESFGGDPDRVTIFGQSAGSSSVSLLLASPKAKGLVRRAIMESGAYWDTEYGPLMNYTSARKLGSSLEAKLGARSLAALRTLSAGEIVEATPYSLAQTKPVLYSPSVDDYIVPVPPSQAFYQSNQAGVDLLAGWNGDEGTLFLPLSFPHGTTAHFEAAGLQWFGAVHSGQFNEVYPGDLRQLNSSALNQVGDMQIREPTFDAAKSQLKLNSSVYVYYFDYSSPHSPLPIHTAEIPYVFGTLDAPSGLGGAANPPPSDQDRNISAIMMNYWTNFAKLGEPTGTDAGLPRWPKFDTNATSTLRITNTTISAYQYPIDSFAFLGEFRTNGVLPLRWQSLNVSDV